MAMFIHRDTHSKNCAITFFNNIQLVAAIKTIHILACNCTGYAVYNRF